MAKVLNPLNSTEARGRVGGLVYNTWRGIRTVKTHTAPGHEDDPKRQAHKDKVIIAAQAWATISDVSRTRWNDYADTHPLLDWTGSPKRLSGFNWYVKINTTLQDLEDDLIENPPTDTCDSIIADPALEYDEPSIGLTWSIVTPGPKSRFRVDLWSTPPLSPGRHPSIHDATRQIIQFATNNGAAFAVAQPGYYTCFWRLITSSGLTSPWSRDRVYVPEE